MVLANDFTVLLYGQMFDGTSLTDKHNAIWMNVSSTLDKIQMKYTQLNVT